MLGHPLFHFMKDIKNCDVDSLAIVESMDPENGTIEFRS